jgi:hypothetical protein
MTTTIRNLSIRVARPDIESLIHAHWDEVALHKDQIKLDPDWEKYYALEDAGCLAVFCAYRDNVIVGYCIFILTTGLHYKNSMMALNDVVYIIPELRTGLGVVGMRMISAVEENLSRRGVDKITWHIKVEHDWSPMMVRKGYAVEERMVSKLLPRKD